MFDLPQQLNFRLFCTSTQIQRIKDRASLFIQTLSSFSLSSRLILQSFPYSSSIQASWRSLLLSALFTSWTPSSSTSSFLIIACSTSDTDFEHNQLRTQSGREHTFRLHINHPLLCIYSRHVSDLIFLSCTSSIEQASSSNSAWLCRTNRRCASITSSLNDFSPF